MTSGRRVAPSTALLMVVEDGQKDIEDVTVVGVVVVAEVVVLTTGATTLSIASFTRVLITPVTLWAGWVAPTVLCMPTTSTGAELVKSMVVFIREVVALTTRATTLSTVSSKGTIVVEAMVTLASTSSKMLEG